MPSQALAVRAPSAGRGGAPSPASTGGSFGAKVEKSASAASGQYETRPLTGGYRSVSGEENASGAGWLAGFSGGNAPAAPGEDKGGAQGKPGVPGNQGIGEDDLELANVRLPIAEGHVFNFFVAVVTICNTVALGLEVEAKREGEVGPWWMLLGLVISCIFLVELFVRMGTYGLAFFTDFWNIADLVVVAGSIVDLTLLEAMGMGGTVRLFSSLRMLRMVQLARLLKAERAFRELWLLVGGLQNSLTSIGWVSLMIMLLLWITSILVTVEIGQNTSTYGFDQGPSYDGEMWPFEEYFGTVFRSMFTMFQVMTLDGWCNEIVRHVLHRQPFMALLFGGYIVVAAFGFIKVIVGIIVENTLAAAAVAEKNVDKKETVRKHRALETLFQVLLKSNPSRSGAIYLEEFEACGEDPTVQRCCKESGLGWEEMKEIVMMLDYTGTGRVDLKDFMGFCRDMLHCGARRDIVHLEMKINDLGRTVDRLDGKIDSMENEMSKCLMLTEDFNENVLRLFTGFDGSRLPPDM